MLSIPTYPRHRWRVGLGITTGLISAGIALGYGIPVAHRTATVIAAQEQAANIADANHFWLMVAGDEPVDNSDLGRVADAARALARQPNPIKAMMDAYVAPGELPNIEDRLGFHAFDRPDPDGRGEAEADQGRYTDRYILHVIQASELLPGASVEDILRPVPEVPDYGWLRWEWGVSALGGVLGLAALFGLWLRRDRRRWSARAKARALADLTDDQRHIYRIVQELERQPYSKERDELEGQAKALFRDMARGVDTSDKLAALRVALADAAETWQLTRDAFNELRDWHAVEQER